MADLAMITRNCNDSKTDSSSSNNDSSNNDSHEDDAIIGLEVAITV